MVSSCANLVSLPPFSVELINKYNINSSDLHNIQFYLSDGISLSREIQQSENREITSSHSLERVGDKLIETIAFPKNTPCVIDSGLLDSKCLIARFESSPNSTLKFCLDDNTGLYTLKSSVKSVMFNEQLYNLRMIDKSAIKRSNRAFGWWCGGTISLLVLGLADDSAEWALSSGIISGLIGFGYAMQYDVNDYDYVALAIVESSVDKSKVKKRQVKGRRLD